MPHNPEPLPRPEGSGRFRFFREDLCDRCGDCFVACPYLELPREEAKREIEALITTGLSRALEAVSYTHLDVYKRQGQGRELYPQAARIAIDRRYIMATCGVLARRCPQAALSLLLDSLELKL